MISDYENKVYNLLKKKHLMRATDFIQDGIPEYIIYDLQNQGKLIRESRGIYRKADAELPAYYDLVLTSLAVPNAVISVVSALDFYQLTLEIPSSVHITIPRTSRFPKLDYPPLEVYRMSDVPYNAGIQNIEIDGNPVKIYSPEKTITDCFKFRSRISEHLALEALKTYINEKKNIQLDLIIHFARINRVEKKIFPYLESLT